MTERSRKLRNAWLRAMFTAMPMAVDNNREGYEVQYDKLQAKGMSVKELGTTGKKRRHKR